jgi:25S rRNA (cytosine2278-C5)-methyltransferase
MSFQYLTAGKLVDAAESGKSLKAFCASIPKLGKTEYALAMQTLKFLPVLREMMKTSGLSAKQLEVKSGVLQVMLYELIFGTGKISGGGVVKRKIMEYKDTLIQLRDKYMDGKSKYEELLSESVQAAAKLPLYVRVNEAKMAISEGLRHMQEHYEADAVLDPLIPTLVVLSPNCKAVARDPLIKEGKLVIQDKASCFPAQILYNEFSKLNSDGERCDFVDACAAPGNKTSHLAALVGKHEVIPVGKGNKRPQSSLNRVFAFDKSPQRAKVIVHRMRQLGVDGIVGVSNKDFLGINVDDAKYEHVQYLLLDPSCSGSGIVRNIERVLDEDKPDEHNENDIEAFEEDSSQELSSQQQRLLNLQTFQISIVQKAMTFPNAHTITYSTCSIHEEENEQVVSAVLNSEIGLDWEIIAPSNFQIWEHRGLPTKDLSEKEAHKLIRCSPEDGTNGFFVALFRKKRMTPRKMKLVEVVQSIEGDNGCGEQPSVVKTRKTGTGNVYKSSFLGQKFSVSKTKKRKFSRK